MKRAKEFFIDPTKLIGSILIVIGLIITPMPWQSRLLFLLGMIFYSSKLKLRS